MLGGNGGKESLGRPQIWDGGDEMLSWSNCVFSLGLAVAVGLPELALLNPFNFSFSS